MRSLPSPSPLSLYLHIPFCRQRCAYCDFNTYAGHLPLIPAYGNALCREIAAVGRAAPFRPIVHTVYFGGGTPSLLSPSYIEQILEMIRRHYALVDDVEITLEANPGAVTRPALSALRRLGVNRLSLGMQSAHADELLQLGRIHSFSETVQSVHWARSAGFANVSLDLLYGLPGQSLDRWQTTVRRAVDLAPDHLSLYALTIEPRTPFGRRLARGLLSPPDPDLAAVMYEWAGDYLEAHGYVQYEISNWARPNFQCRHNLTYWRNQPYLGFGAGAHGYARGYRYANVRRLDAYLRRLLDAPNGASFPFPFSPATTQRRFVSPRAAIEETMILGLRLTGEGVAADDFQQRFSVSLTQVFGSEIEELLRLGLIEWARDERTRHRPALRLTRRGRLLGNQVFLRFIRA